VRYSSISYIVLIFIFAGCSIPDEPHPKNPTRLVFIGNTPLTFVLSSTFAPYNGYFESSISQHIDSSESRFECDGSFYNHLGNAFLPEQPFSLFANDRMLFDTSTQSKYTFTLINNDSLDFSKPLIWYTNGSKDIPSFIDTLMPPQKVELIFPTPNQQNILPGKSFTIKYNVVGSDSVFFQFLIFSTDTTTNYFYQSKVSTSNTGTFEVNDKIIPFPPFRVSIHISLAAVTQKVHWVNGENYLIRAGIIDNAGLRLTD
jgi:hypothetical protein